KNVALKNLFFETNKADLSDESIVELSNVIKLSGELQTNCDGKSTTYFWNNQEITLRGSRLL
ncbi:MAG: hypothetical protein IIT94_09055, partial [Prevotella sp.]|nr:hypothetical protein [Prevotella sp.]